MSVLKLKIDVLELSATLPGARSSSLIRFRAPNSAHSSAAAGGCNHPPDAPHAKGEWIGAEIRLQTPLLAQYAMSHYLEQERVLDADVE